MSNDDLVWETTLIVYLRAMSRKRVSRVVRVFKLIHVFGPDSDSLPSLFRQGVGMPWGCGVLGQALGALQWPKSWMELIAATSLFT